MYNFKMSIKYKVNLAIIVSVFGIVSCSLEPDSVQEVEVIQGHAVYLTCNIDPERTGDTYKTIRWFKGDQTEPIYSYDRRGARTSDSTEAGTARPGPAAGELASRLVFAPARPDQLQLRRATHTDAALYKCIAEPARSPTLTTYVELRVVVPPESVSIVDEQNRVMEDNSVIGPYDEGIKFVLICIAIGGNPKPKITWYRNDKIEKESSETISEKRTRSFLRISKLERDYLNAVLRCEASNHKFAKPVSKTVTLNMNLSPLHVNLFVTNNELRSGTQAELQCEVKGAWPQPNITWWKQRKLIDLEQEKTVNQEYNIVTSSVKLDLTQEDDKQELTCCSGNPIKSHPLQCDAIIMNIEYAPIVEVTLNDEKLKEVTLLDGENLTLTCEIQANPSISSFSWYFNNETIHSKSVEQNSTAPCTTLSLENVNASSAGEYYCSATNTVDTTDSAVMQVEVIYPPRCILSGPLEYGIAKDEAINISVDMDAHPPPEDYNCLYSDKTFDDTEHLLEEIESFQPFANSSESVFQYSVTDVYKYGTLACWASNEVGNSSAPCIFTLMDMSRPHPPHNCDVYRNSEETIIVHCDPGHDGGSPQEFKLDVISKATNITELTMFSKAPHFSVLVQDDGVPYEVQISAFNVKGPSRVVTLHKIRKQEKNAENESVPETKQLFSNISTLVFSLIGGVGILVLIACSIVMGVREKWGSLEGSAGAGFHEETEIDGDYDQGKTHTREIRDFAHTGLSAYGGEESECQCQDNETNDDSIRRSESFRRAMTPKCQPKIYDSRRIPSFRSAKVLNESQDQSYGALANKDCKLHSLQNVACQTLNRGRNVDALCDHLLMRLPPDAPNYNVPKPPKPFLTMPRRIHNKPIQNFCDDFAFDAITGLTPSNDGFLLPPPPDELTTTPISTRHQSQPSTRQDFLYGSSYGHEVSKAGSASHEYPNVIISPMNTVGLPSTTATYSNTFNIIPMRTSSSNASMATTFTTAALDKSTPFSHSRDLDSRF